MAERRFVYSAHRRPVVRRLTPAGWLVLAVGVVTMFLAAAWLVNAIAAHAEARQWGTGGDEPIAVAMDTSTPLPIELVTRTPVTPVEPTVTPAGIWWADRIEDGLPPASVQAAVIEAWEAYWSHVHLPLERFAVLSADDLIEQYATTPDFAARIIDNAAHFDKHLATGYLLKPQSDFVNLRDGPGTAYAVTGQASESDKLLLLGEKTGDEGQTWYRAWLQSEAREVWVASWVVEVRDNFWPFPQYQEHTIVVHDCEADVCETTDTMRDGGTGWFNLVTGENGLLESETAPYPNTGYLVRASLVFDEERERWLVDQLLTRGPLPAATEAAPD